MSFSIFIQKFKDQEPAPIKIDDLSNAISEFGEIKETEFGLEIISTVGEMYETASLHEDGTDGVSGVAIHRPTYNKKLKEMIFVILGFEGTCFFDQDLDLIQHRKLNSIDLPKELFENAEKGIEQVRVPDEIWPEE